MNLSVTFDRTELELDPLVVSNFPSPESPFWLPEDGLTLPEFPERTAFAPESAYIPGKRALASQQDAGGLALVIYAQAADTAALAVLKAELAAALRQWRPAITVDVDGESTVYEAVYPVTPHWGQVDSGMVRAHMARTAVTVVVNPPDGA